MVVFNRGKFCTVIEFPLINYSLDCWSHPRSGYPTNVQCFLCFSTEIKQDGRRKLKLEVVGGMACISRQHTH